MSFDTLGLCAELQQAVKEQNFTTPTPIQQQAIPVILSGKDLMASAQTGTGKTAGFVLPILQKLYEIQVKTNQNPLSKKSKRPLYALILAPTRELAAQIGENIRELSQYIPVRSLVAFVD